LSFDRKRQVDRHLVTVKVSVEAFTDQRVDLDRVSFDENRLESLNPHSVESRSAVQEDGMLVNDVIENVPDLLVLSLEHLLGALDGVRVAQLFEPSNDEGLVELERYLLGKTALVNLELGADGYHGPRAVVHALSKQVLTEAPLLALDHVGQGLERAVVGAQDRPPAAVVVEESIHRMLEHALFVPDDD